MFMKRRQDFDDVIFVVWLCNTALMADLHVMEIESSPFSKKILNKCRIKTSHPIIYYVSHNIELNSKKLGP